MSDQTEDAVERFLASHEANLTVRSREADAWEILVPAYAKQAIAVGLRRSRWGLRADTFFMRRPMEQADLVYELVLRRCARAHLWKFYVTDDGDLALRAEMPATSIDEEELGRLFGTLISIVEDTYLQAVGLGFASVMALQVEAGGPGIDAVPPWAK